VIYRGHSFISLNENLLDEYANCETAAEVIDAQNRFLDAYLNPPSTGISSMSLSDDRHNANPEEGGYLRADDLPPSDSDDGEESEREDLP
jgi:hypothetical protein